MQSDAEKLPAMRKMLHAALLRDTPSFARLLSIYRYASVMLTSAFYLTAQPAAWAPYKIAVVVTLAVSAVIVNALLNLHTRDANYVSVAIVIETVGISLLLVPTGGMDSPYLWYALNPVLAAACCLRPLFSWVLLGFYYLTATLVSAVFNPEYTGILAVVEKRGVYFLVFILAALAMQLLAQLIRKKTEDHAALQARKEELDAANVKLKLLNEKLKESVDDLFSLYQSVDDLAAETDQSVALACLTQYAVKLSRSPFAFFIMTEKNKKGEQVIFDGESPARAEIERMAGELLDGVACYEEPVIVTVSGCELLTISVKSTTKLYGLLGITVNTGGSGRPSQVDSSRLGFIANLCGIVLERAGANEVENRLTIAQERNRIADEIHDSICQRLFSITCSAHSLTSRYGDMSRQELLEQLALIEECAKAANQEIRLCVYGLSGKKRQEHALFEELEKYLWSYAKLNGIVLNMDLKGDDSLIGVNMQKSLHRIVREACGNAARHGKCRNIDVRLSIQAGAVCLRITDDGVGFSVEEDRSGTSSVGIKNMKTMTEQYGGTFHVKSELRKGTTIMVKIPLIREDEAGMKEAVI